MKRDNFSSIRNDYHDRPSDWHEGPVFIKSGTEQGCWEITGRSHPCLARQLLASYGTFSTLGFICSQTRDAGASRLFTPPQFSPPMHGPEAVSLQAMQGIASHRGIKDDSALMMLDCSLPGQQYEYLLHSRVLPAFLPRLQILSSKYHSPASIRRSSQGLRSPARYC